MIIFVLASGMFEYFSTQGEYLWIDVSVEDILQFSVLMKHSKLPQISHPDMETKSINSYTRTGEIVHITQETTVSGNVPSEQVFLFCMINCDTGCAYHYIKNEDGTEYEFDDCFMEELMETVVERKFHYTMVFYLAVQLFGCMNDNAACTLYDIYKNEKYELEVINEDIVEPYCDKIVSCHGLIDLIKKFNSGAFIPFEKLAETEIYKQFWNIKKHEIKSASNV